MKLHACIGKSCRQQAGGLAHLQLSGGSAGVPARHALRVALPAVLLQLVRRREGREAALALRLLAQEVLRPSIRIASQWSVRTDFSCPGCLCHLLSAMLSQAL